MIVAVGQERHTSALQLAKLDDRQRRADLSLRLQRQRHDLAYGGSQNIVHMN